MNCKLCLGEFPNPRAVSEHWKTDHSKEFKARQRAKAAASAIPEPEATLDVEATVINECIAAIEGYEMAAAQRGRVVAYLALRYPAVLA